MRKERGAGEIDRPEINSAARMVIIGLGSCVGFALQIGHRGSGIADIAFATFLGAVCGALSYVVLTVLIRWLVSFVRVRDNGD